MSRDTYRSPVNLARPPSSSTRTGLEHKVLNWAAHFACSLPDQQNTTLQFEPSLNMSRFKYKTMSCRQLNYVRRQSPCRYLDIPAECVKTLIIHLLFHPTDSHANYHRSTSTTYTAVTAVRLAFLHHSTCANERHTRLISLTV